MTDDPHTHIGTPTPEELREQVERTRDELGATVEALAGKADVKARAKEKTAAVKEQAAQKSALVAGQIRTKAQQAARLVKDRTPDPVLDPLLDSAGRGATLARSNRGPLLAFGAALVVILLIRRGRGRR
ncbi:DUF3618 domain-containing protein [Streptomyces sp. NPDC048507]|uniref:DUF3618 domain-containing protein n=1 Tax=Streptomyces sp. NPDC048507 TaxID=3365560 RepID=UPI0037149914